MFYTYSRAFDVQAFTSSTAFSQIRFGSQVDLIIPISPHMRLETLVPDTYHVEAGIDPLVRIHRC